MFTKILVPLDGSAFAERALPPALVLAQRAEAQLSLLRAVAPERMLVADSHVLMLGGYSAVWPNQSLELARQAAADYLSALRAAKIPKGLRLSAEMIEGDPAEIIVETARNEGVDLIVMSSHGYSGLTRWILGSVAERVLHDAPCPVLIVRTTDPIRHVLIPLDGSELSEQILEPAFALAASLECKVTLNRVIERLSAEEFEYLEHLENGLGQRLQSDTHAEAEQYLHGVATARRSAVPELKTVVLHGSPAQSLLEYAHMHGVDLIAMSTHGRTGLKRWVYGSVTEKVLRAATDRAMLVSRPAFRK